jgi:hypothetical protein
MIGESTYVLLKILIFCAIAVQHDRHTRTPSPQCKLYDA